MADQSWSVYLSGEIHSDWRERIKNGVEEKKLPIDLLAPVTDHRRAKGLPCAFVDLDIEI